MHKRITAVFCILTLVMTGLIYRIYYINASDYVMASVQRTRNLSVSTTRGTIYDRNFHPLVNTDSQYMASVMPTPQAAAALGDILPEEDMTAVLNRMTAGQPFRIEVPDNGIFAQGIDIFRVPVRYGQTQFAPHVIGYLGSEGEAGAAGIEKAYDDWLKQNGGSIHIGYQVDAAGHLMQGAPVQVQRENEGARGGVVLTIDRDIQRVTQQALQNGCEKGAAVVLDVYSGDILAMASLPVFDQNHISASLDSEDAPFVNRATSGYNIGSVFKVIVSAAALENGFSESFEHECLGYIDIDGQIFRCNNNAVHGKVNMQTALQKSCNTYFIHLAQEMGPEYLRVLTGYMGIGTATELAPGITTQAGNVPTAEELQNPASLANFSFGQGSSLATPLQIAQAIASIANSGLAVTPRLVQGLTGDGETLSTHVPGYTSNQIISESTSARMRKLMIGVVSEGSGRTATPFIGGAGGKTSSAQTGRIVDDKEIVHAWFAGFYPAQKPKYSIVVFVEGGESGERVAAPIFKNIADGIAIL